MIVRGEIGDRQHICVGAELQTERKENIIGSYHGAAAKIRQRESCLSIAAIFGPNHPLVTRLRSDIRERAGRSLSPILKPGGT